MLLKKKIHNLCVTDKSCIMYSQDLVYELYSYYFWIITCLWTFCGCNIIMIKLFLHESEILLHHYTSLPILVSPHYVLTSLYSLVENYMYWQSQPGHISFSYPWTCTALQSASSSYSSFYGRCDGVVCGAQCLGYTLPRVTSSHLLVYISA